MTPRTTLDSQLERLLELTEAAIRQARIRQTDELTLTLAERKRMLAVVWGFDPEGDLPPFSSEVATQRRERLGHYNPEIAARLRELEPVLMNALSNHLEALRAEQGSLQTGRRYMNSVRSVYAGNSVARRLDEVG